jgi:DNA gyrase subunit A
MDKFDFTEVQAQAILDMQLRRLAALERMKIQNEHKEIKAKIKEYNEILENQDRILEVVSTDLEEIKEKYGDKRRTKVVKGKIDEISEEDMIASEDTLVTITHSGYIKRLPPNTYKAQHRGGKGVSGGDTKEGDFIEHAFLCNTHDELLLFTNMGKVFNLRIFEIPELGRTAKGLPLVNLVQFEQDEIVTSVLTRSPKGEISQKREEKEHDAYKYFLMATEKGIVKKSEIDDFANIRVNGLIAINLEDGDQLSWVKPTTGKDEIILITKEGKSIRFKESDVRPMGRNTRGVTGIKFKSDTDCVVGMGVVNYDDQKLLTLSEFGYGKMSLLKEYGTQKRGGTGIYTFRITKKTGDIATARILTDEDEEIVVISEKSKVIRSDVKAVPTQGRQTSGVKVMNINGGDRVATVALL